MKPNLGRQRATTVEIAVGPPHDPGRVTVAAWKTKTPGIVVTAALGPLALNEKDYYSLTHVATGWQIVGGFTVDEVQTAAEQAGRTGMDFTVTGVAEITKMGNENKEFLKWRTPFAKRQRELIKKIEGGEGL